MDRAELERRLQEAEYHVERGEQNIVHQRSVIETLERGGHDAKAAHMFLRRLESAQAKHVAERSRLFKELADDSEAKSSPRSGPR
jgi:hypothetical protein